MITQVNQREAISYEKPDKPWEFVEKQIKRSNIKRFDWKSIFGMSLTRQILSYKISGRSVEVTTHLMINHPTIKELAKTNPNFCAELCRKIKISVYARYGENNSSLRLYSELR